MAETVAVLSQKGGTGKTTTVRTLTDVFRRAGLEVLARLAGDQAGALDPALAILLVDRHRRLARKARPGAEEGGARERRATAAGAVGERVRGGQRHHITALLAPERSGSGQGARHQ